MIDFELTENDQKILDEVRRRALVCREYARYYDENEHEFPPDELEEARDTRDAAPDGLSEHPLVYRRDPADRPGNRVQEG